MAKRSYFIELQEINSTWNNVDKAIISFSDIDRKWFFGNIFCVGSGGALSLARLWQNVHESHGLGIAKTLTPYEFHYTHSKPDLVVLFSASGKNHDILEVFRAAIARGCRVLIFTTKEKSSLVKLAKSYPLDAKIISPQTKIPQDGFLAVNSTIAMSCLIAKLEEYLCGVAISKESPVQTAILDHNKLTNDVEQITKKTVHIISSNWGSPAGLDFEARLAESGVSQCFLTDPRNLGHGRFIWLEKWQSISQMVLFYDDESKSLINRILKVIPENIKCYQIYSPFNKTLGAIYFLTRSILLFGAFARHFDNDPGKPSVPEWGRKLHRFKIANKFYGKGEISAPGKNISDLPVFNTAFSGVVLDFDGTVVDTKDRYLPIPDKIISQFERLLKNGIKIGIATGRGSSAYRALKKQISPEYHKSIYVGLYNGTLINSVAEELRKPTGVWHLRRIIDSLLDCADIESSKISSRKTQISIRKVTNKKIDELIHYLSSSLGQHSRYIKFCKSAHSLDIIPFWASKITLVQSLCDSLNSNILCIGDQGQIGGNDEELLSWTPSISVGSKQPASNQCYWLGKNREMREVTGTSVILESIIQMGKEFKIEEGQLGSLR